MTPTSMDSIVLNTTTELVRGILLLTDEKRHSPAIQSMCQRIYFKFPIDDYDGPNVTYRIVPTKFPSLHNVSLQSDNDDFTTTAKYISTYIYPIFIFMGIIGNSLSCHIMFLNVRRNGYSANLYLALLAFVDCLFLLGSALPNWIAVVHATYPIISTSHLSCRFFYWFGHFTTHLSAGLVVSVTVERFIAIQYPLIAHKINTAKHTHIVLIVLISFLFLLDSRIFILVKHVKVPTHIVLTCYNDSHIEYLRTDGYRCSTTNENKAKNWIFIDFAVYTLIPFLIIVTLNCLIIRRLITAQRMRLCMSHSKKKSFTCEQQQLNRDAIENLVPTSERNPSLTRSQTVPVPRALSITFRPQLDQRRLRSRTEQSIASMESSLEIRYHFNSHDGNSFIRRAANSNNIRLTILLLFVSWSFLALTLPAVVLNLILTIQRRARSSTFENNFTSMDDNVESDVRFYYAIARLLMIINHSINFILYFVVGKRFRRDLKKLCYSC